MGNILDDTRWCSARIPSELLARNTRGERMKSDERRLKGTSYDKSRGLWLASITFRRKQRNLGRYKTVHEAHEAYCREAARCFGDKALLEDGNCGPIHHGMHGTRTWRIWAGIIKRVSHPNSLRFEDYGGRGIDCDPKWLLFEEFLRDMGECPGELTIERINNNRGYWKANCRWATYTEQANNKRTNKFVTMRGKTQTVSEWTRELGMSREVFSRRLKLGLFGNDVEINKGRKS